MVTDTQSTKHAGQSLAPINKLYMEKTLLRISGALFCHDAKRARTRTAEIQLNRGVKEKNIVIRPDPRLGQPGPLAHKIFVAIIKKHSDYGRPVQSDVSFTKRELVRLIGRKEWGGSANEQLARALNDMALRIQHQISDSKYFRFFLRATQERVHPDQKLLKRERLDQVIIGAGLQPGHTINNVTAPAQDQHARG